MERGRGILSCLSNKKKPKEEEKSFLKNGSLLLEELITSWNGKCNIPIRSFSAKELITATNNFDQHHNCIVERGPIGGKLYIGSFQRRPIFVKIDSERSLHDIVITSQMSHHKNVLKLIGCCLEFKLPALVYEYAGDEVLLSKLIYNRRGGSDVGQDEDRSLSWKSRLRVAKDITSALVYLHTAFATPIIYRDLKPSNVIIDQCGVAKLFDFSLSILLPPGESQVQDPYLSGTFGYLDPEYIATGIITEKSDVYSFGMLLLELLTGRSANDITDDEGNYVRLADDVKDYVEKDKFNEIVDPRILGEDGGTEQEQQLQAFLALALRCIQLRKEDRPEMIDVAKELRRIERSVYP